MITIRTLGKDDIPFAYKMTQKENWAYRKIDFSRLILFEPNGCFMALSGDRAVGIITSTSYDNYGFLGTLIVDREYRKQGIANKLLITAIEYLESKEVKTIELDGVVSAVPLYRRLGFRDKFWSLRMIRPARQIPGKSQNPEIADEHVIELDCKLTGLNRRRLLTEYLKSSPEAVIVDSGDNPEAFAICRNRADDSIALGPIVAKSNKNAGVVIDAAINQYSDKVIKVGIPMTNLDSVSLLLERGFQFIQPSLRMYRGNKLDYEKHIFAIFSAEKG